MQIFDFGLYSLNDIKHLDVSCSNDTVDLNQTELVQDLKRVLAGHPMLAEGSIMIGIVDPDTEKELQALIVKYKDVDIPQLKALPSYFAKTIGVGRYYAVTLNRSLDINETLALCNQIHSIESGVSLEELMQRDHDLLGEVITHYNIHANDGSHRIQIGPKERADRVCRYCNKKVGEVTFNKVAHTISEGFGNKHIITNDECDECNEYFGKYVEPDLIEYLDPFRVFFGVQGKKGVIHHKYGENYEIIREDDGTLKINITLTDEEIAAGKAENLKDVQLKGHLPLLPQNVYKSLVKYALGILPPETMAAFQNTLQWLRFEKKVDRLPIMRLESGAHYKERPAVVTMIRKDDDESLPYAVAELQIMNFTFLYIIPMCDERDEKFLGEGYWDRFLDCFKMYRKRYWEKKDFSSIIPIQLTAHFRFTQKGEQNK